MDCSSSPPYCSYKTENPEKRYKNYRNVKRNEERSIPDDLEAGFAEKLLLTPYCFLEGI